MEFSDIILKYFSDKNIQPSTIAKSIGIDKSTFSKWKVKPTSKIDFETVYKIASYLNISIDYLISGKDNKINFQLSLNEKELLLAFNKLSERDQIKFIGRAEQLVDECPNYNPSPKNMISINIAEVAAGAGVSTPFTIDDAFTLREFPRDAIPPNTDCGVPINGDSMEPQYPNGCIAWVKCTNTADFGDVVIAVLNGEPYCKIYQQDGLHSFNKNYETIHVYEQDNFYIFGKVIGNFME